MTYDDPVKSSREIASALGLATPLIRVRGKAPLDLGWTDEPRRFPTIWEGKLDGWRGELGIPCGLRADGTYLVVLDFDLYKEGAEDSRARLFELGLPRATVTGLTPRGGEHLYYVSPVPIRSRELDGFPGVDIKCVGGQVVLYEWEFGYGPLDHPIAELGAGSKILATLVGDHDGHARVSTLRSSSTDDDERMLAVLEAHFGAHGAHWNGRYYTVTRPGKETGVSATIGEISPGGLHNFSSSWPGLPEGNYDLRELCRMRGLPHPVDAALQEIFDRLPRVGGRVAPTLHELMSATPIEHDWLIPGILERGDRVVLTAGAGVGKSTLLRQIACGAALGMNALADDPWRELMRPVRSLIIDLENSARQLRREFEKVREIVGDAAFDRLAPLVHFECRTEGLVLDLATRPFTEDREWLAATVEGTEPDLVVIGPLYKMQGGRPNDEESSRDMAKWLDRLRGEHGFALVIEAHTAKAAGEQRPSGSSTWLRWPEYGIYLAATGELVHWRGQREERAWPEKLTRSAGSIRPGEWLWKPSVPELGTGRSREAEYELAVEMAICRMLHAYRAPLTREEIIERVDRRGSAVRAAIFRLATRGVLVVVSVERELGKGAKRACDGYELAPEWRADDDQ